MAESPAWNMSVVANACRAQAGMARFAQVWSPRSFGTEWRMPDSRLSTHSGRRLMIYLLHLHWRKRSQLAPSGLASPYCMPGQKHFTSSIIGQCLFHTLAQLGRETVRLPTRSLCVRNVSCASLSTTDSHRCPIASPQLLKRRQDIHSPRSRDAYCMYASSEQMPRPWIQGWY